MQSSVIFHPIKKKLSSLYKVGELLYKDHSYRVIDICDEDNELVVSDKYGNIYSFSGATGECLTDDKIGTIPKIVLYNCPIEIKAKLKGVTDFNSNNNNYNCYIFLNRFRECLKMVRKTYPGSLAKVRLSDANSDKVYAEYIIENPSIRVYSWYVDLYGKPFYHETQFVDGDENQRVPIYRSLSHKTENNHVLKTLITLGGYEKRIEIIPPTEDEIKAFQKQKNKKV